MPAFANDRISDFGLNVLDTEATGYYLCTQQPTTYAEATTTYDGTAGKYAVASKASGFSATPPADGVTNGRRVSFPAITDGTCVASHAAATHYAVVDSVNSRLLIAHTLVSPVATAIGATMTNTAFDFTKPDPA